MMCREGGRHATDSGEAGEKATDYSRWTGWEDTRVVHPWAEGERVILVDPFASIQQQQPLAPYPSVQSPLAIFSPAGSSRSSNTLVPAGSISNIKFGAFSPKQPNLMPSPRTTLASPFAGAPLLNRSSTLSSSQGSVSNQNSAGNGLRSTAKDSQSALRGTPEEKEPASPAVPFQQRVSTGVVLLSKTPNKCLNKLLRQWVYVLHCPIYFLAF